MTAPSSANRLETLPHDVRRALVESAFADSKTMVLGAVMTCLSGFLISIVSNNLASAVATAAIVVVTAIRLTLIREFRLRAQTEESIDLRRLERTYLFGTSAYLLCIGLLTFSSFTGSNDTFILTLACSTAITHALSIAVRNFAIQNGVSLQIAVVAIPLAAAFVVKGGVVSSPCCDAPPAALFVYIWVSHPIA